MSHVHRRSELLGGGVQVCGQFREHVTVAPGRRIARVLRRRAVLSVLFAFACIPVLACLVAETAGLTARYPLSATLLALGALVFGIALVPGAAARRRLSIADHVTLTRAALALLVAAFIGHGAQAATAALVLAAIAAALDALDGWIARRANAVSEFGARFDMETDALLVLALSVLAWQWDKAGAWVLLAGGARYLFVIAACCLPWMRRPLPESVRRKSACAIQVVALLVCVAPWVPATLSGAVAAAGLALLLVSFFLDLCWLRARA